MDTTFLVLPNSYKFLAMHAKRAIYPGDLIDPRVEGESKPPQLRMAASSSATLSTSSSRFEYDVFLSFRGKDTRLSFADHLFCALQRNGVRAFRDKEGLQAGQKIGKLFGAIDSSKIFVPIFSVRYAHSKWCLKEIDKIVKVAGEGEDGRLILPVFYKIKPTHVGNQTGPFKEAFRNHKNDNRVDVQTVEEWKVALRKAADISGYEINKIADGYEAPLVEMIVQRVIQELHNERQAVVERLVGIDSRVKDVIEILKLGSDDARLVGIQGMEGVGKTTVTKAVYNKIKILFESHCFIGDVRKQAHQTGGLVKLQDRLVHQICQSRWAISNTDDGSNILRRILLEKRVLIVLDDVDSLEEIQALAGQQNWYHSGSRIIITAEDEAILHDFALHSWQQPGIYKVKLLDENESLQLFSWHAFGQQTPADGYEEHSRKIVIKLDGLPLAIKIFASTLYNDNDKKNWDEAVNTLNRLPDDRIYKAVKVSYDHLSHQHHRSIFLDVACFFSTGIDIETAICIWDACDFSPSLSIKALIYKSLINIIDGKLKMPNILRQMGRRIVEEESGTTPETRSRLWIQDQIMGVLEHQKGTSKIEGISLLISGGDRDLLSQPVEAAGFSSMNCLRLLMINNVNLRGGYGRMPNCVKWLQWQRCPLKFLPPDFHLKEVAALDLSHSNIIQVRRKQRWSLHCMASNVLRWFTGTRNAMTEAVFEKLQFLDLTACRRLTVSPDLSAFPGLKKLVLDRCDNLVQIDGSIATLRRLVVLSMSDCPRLRELPDCMLYLTSLKQLNVANCISLKNVPDFIGQLTSLEKICMYNCTSLEELPSSRASLQELN